VVGKSGCQLELRRDSRISCSRRGKLNRTHGFGRNADLVAREVGVISNDPLSLTLPRFHEGSGDDGKELHEILPNQTAKRHNGLGSLQLSRVQGIGFKENLTKTQTSSRETDLAVA
jgi:hypothetical protein